MRYLSSYSAIACLGLVLAGCATNLDLVREAGEGHTAAVHAMLAKGADVNAGDRDGKTALMLATFEGQKPTVEFLLGNGAQVNSKDKDGSTALMLAASRGHTEIVARLLDKGADVNAQNGAGQTALMLAVQAGHANIIQALRAKGADLEVKNRTGQTAVTLAQAKGIADLLEQSALAKGASANEGASLLAQVEKQTLEKEQLKRELERERQKAQGQNQLRVADHTPPPRIMIQQPANAQNTRGLSVAETDFRVVGTVSDGAGTRKLFINGKPVHLDLQGRFSHNMRLNPGNNVIVLNALDAQGRTTESSFTVRNSGSPAPVAVGVKASRPLGFGRYHALVIGNNAYEHLPRLETAVNDAEVVSEVLRGQYGFEVTLLLDTTRDKIIRALDEMRTKLTDQDNLLIYYAGHGTLDKEAERGYWLPVNAHPDTRVHWLSTTEITDTLKAMTAKHVLLVADSCYSGTLLRDAGESLRSGLDKETFYSRLAQKRSRTALTSGGQEPVLDGGGGSHSVFTKAFLTVLRENAAILEGQQLSSQIKRLVVVNSPQTPEYSDIRSAGHDGGDFLFVRLP